MQDFDVAAATGRLSSQGGGYEVVHTSPGLEIGVYVLIAPGPDRQSPHAFDEVYVVLDGEGEIEVEHGGSGSRRARRCSSRRGPTTGSRTTSG